MSEVIQRNAEEVEAIAERMGLVCILPEENELQIDADHPWNPDVFDRVEKVLQENNGIQILDKLTTISKNGRKHVYMRLSKSVAPSTRIAIQSCLGSDPIREILSIIRLMSGSDAPTALFETKLQAARVENWRTGRKRKLRKTAVVDPILTDDDVPF